MKAVFNEKYGLPDILQLKEVSKPEPKENEVLVKIHAASVNSWDWDLLTGKPKLYRIIFGLFKPKINILGCDVAGVVENIGGKVTRFKPGDKVFGDNSSASWGAYAEYVCMSEQNLEIMPSSMSFVDAAAIPQAGVLAFQAITQAKKLRPGDKVLLVGAGGGVGTFAFQMAKDMGAEVTVVDRNDKLEFLKNLGADHTMDYKNEDFSKQGIQYDLIIDVVAFRTFSAYKRALKANGVLFIVGGSISSIIKVGLLGSLFVSKGRKLKILIHKTNYGLSTICDLYSRGKLKPVIDRIYTLEEVPEALQYIGDSHVKGKVVIKII